MALLPGVVAFPCAARVFGRPNMCKIGEKTCQKGICVVKVSWVGIALPSFAMSLRGGYSLSGTISPPVGVEMSEGNPPKGG